MEAPKIRYIRDNKNKKLLDNNVIPNNTVVDIINDGLKENVHLPKGVKIDDIDLSVINCFEEYFDFNIEGEKVPIHSLSLQKESEYSNVMANLNEVNDYEYPLFFLTKEHNAQVGTNFKQYNIATEELFLLKSSYLKEGNENYIENFYVPQPVKVDITYFLEFVGETLTHVNEICEKIIAEFSSKQLYINPNGFYMPLLLEEITDQSEIDLEKRRYYSQRYKITCKGYILNKENFRVIKVPEKVNISFNLGETKNHFCIPLNDSNGNCYAITMKFNRRNKENIFFAEEPIILRSSNISDLSDFTISVNEILTTLPIILNEGDYVNVKYVGDNSNNFLLKLYK